MLKTIAAAILIVVSGIIVWLLVRNRSRSKKAPSEAYVCPVCNGRHCDCYKKSSRG